MSVKHKYKYGIGQSIGGVKFRLLRHQTTKTRADPEEALEKFAKHQKNAEL